MDNLSYETTSISLGDEPPPQPARRSDRHHLTLLRVGAITIGDRRELCLIRNISAGGMSIRSYSPLAVGTPVLIELKTGMRVPGTVAWVDDGTAGVEFKEPVDVLDVLSSTDDGPTPRMPRIEVDCYASVRAGAVVRGLRVCDISQGGVKLAGHLSTEVASDLSVTLPGMSPQPASLRWSCDGHVGLTFNRLLPLPDLVEWLRSVRDRPRAA